MTTGNANHWTNQRRKIKGLLMLWLSLVHKLDKYFLALGYNRGAKKPTDFPCQVLGLLESLKSVF